MLKFHYKECLSFSVDDPDVRERSPTDSGRLLRSLGVLTTSVTGAEWRRGSLGRRSSGCCGTFPRLRPNRRMPSASHLMGALLWLKCVKTRQDDDALEPIVAELARLFVHPAKCVPVTRV